MVSVVAQAKEQVEAMQRSILGDMASNGEYPGSLIEWLWKYWRSGTGNTTADELRRARILRLFQDSMYEERPRRRGEKADTLTLSNVVYPEAPEVVFRQEHYYRDGRPRTPRFQGTVGQVHGGHRMGDIDMWSVAQGTSSLLAGDEVWDHRPVFNSLLINFIKKEQITRGWKTMITKEKNWFRRQMGVE